MIFIKTYIKTIKKEIKDLNPKVKDYFAEFETLKKTNLELEKTNYEYLEGYIYIRYGDDIIMDFYYFDNIIYLWGYFINAFEELLLEGKALFYFPDQPIEIKMKFIGKKQILLTLDKKFKFVLPSIDFLELMLNEAYYFWENIKVYFGQKNDAEYELERIKKLRALLDEQ